MRARQQCTKVGTTLAGFQKKIALRDCARQQPAPIDQVSVTPTPEGETVERFFSSSSTLLPGKRRCNTTNTRRVHTNVKCCISTARAIRLSDTGSRSCLTIERGQLRTGGVRASPHGCVQLVSLRMSQTSIVRGATPRVPCTFLITRVITALKAVSRRKKKWGSSREGPQPRLIGHQ